MKTTFTFLLMIILLLQSFALQPQKTFTVNTDKQYQTIEGFGTSLFNFGSYWKEFPELYRTPEFQDFDLAVSQVKKPNNRRDMQVFIDFAKAFRTSKNRKNESGGSKYRRRFFQNDNSIVKHCYGAGKDKVAV